MRPTLQWRSETLLLAALLAAVTFAAYARTLGNGFVAYDDEKYVTQNAVVLAGLTWRGIAWAFTTLHASNWHPLTWISHMADAELFGVRAGGHHLTSVLLHLGSTLLLFRFLEKATGAKRRSAVAAALFALHPLHVESVAWVSERKDVLSTFFALCALSAYAGYTRRPGVVRYAWVTTAFAAALLSKPMAVTLPFVMLLLDFWPLRRPEARPLRLLLEKTPWFMLAFASCLVTLRAQNQAVAAIDILSVESRLSNALVSNARYLGKLAWPIDLTAFYPHPYAWSILAVAASALLLAAITVLAALVIRTRPYLLIGWLWYLGTLVPVIGLVQVGWQSIADRYTYLPSIGLGIAVVWGIADLWHERKLAPAWGAAVVIAACAAFAVLTWRQIGYWKNPLSLWAHALRVDPENASAWSYSGHAKHAMGDLKGAMADYSKAIALQPGLATTYNERGLLCLGAGDLEGAIADFREAIRCNPAFAQAHNHLGLAWLYRGDLERALVETTEALRIDPGLVEALASRAQVHARSGDLAAARADLDRAVDSHPRYFEARFNRGVLRERMDDPTGAEWDYTAAIVIDPASAVAYGNRANLRIQRNDLEGAMADLDRALTHAPRLASAWLSRGIVRQLRGDLAGSIGDCGKAAELEPSWVEPYRCRAEARRLQGDSEGSREDLRRAEALARSR